MPRTSQGRYGRPRAWGEGIQKALGLRRGGVAGGRKEAFGGLKNICRKLLTGLFVSLKVTSLTAIKQTEPVKETK